jgi:hypothetical protein
LTVNTSRFRNQFSVTKKTDPRLIQSDLDPFSRVDAPFVLRFGNGNFHGALNFQTPLSGLILAISTDEI